MQRVFVAGGTGVLGRRAIPALRSAGHAVTVNVRSDDARQAATALGADPVTVDLFDADAVAKATVDHDVVINIATSIPTGVAAIRPSAWSMNDRLRTEASAHMAAAAIEQGARYIGESITFPYDAAGDEWIDEDAPCSYFKGNRSTVDAEHAAALVTQAGGVGVSLRFAMFAADDSAHITQMRSIAARGLFALPGSRDAYVSFIHIDDAASAVVAALTAPSGMYNVAEPNPVRRRDHADALSVSLGRTIRFMPAFTARLGGAALVSLARSQRVSSLRFTDATGWEPSIDVSARW